MRTRFRTMLAPISCSTGDGRRFADNSIELAPTPFPFEWVRERQGGHEGAVTIGVVNEATTASVADAIAGGWISAEAAEEAGLDGGLMAVWARGDLFDDARESDLTRLADDVAEAMYLIREGTLGPSVDLDSFDGIAVKEGTDDKVTYEDLEAAEEAGEDLKIELLVTSGRVRAATLVSIPSFLETSRPMELVTGQAVVASVTGSTDLPIADRDREWDGPAAARRVFEHYTDGDSVDTESVAQAFLYRDPEGDPQTQAAYKLGFADVIDGELTIVPRGVAATAGGRGVDATSGIPDHEKTTIKNKICNLYSAVRDKFDDWPDCPFDDGEAATRGAAAAECERELSALVASVAPPTLPRVMAFDAPELRGPTPITIDFESGRIFGHIAEWRTCHRGYSDTCMLVPREDSSYAWFHRYPTETDGGLVWTGRLTVGGVHPELSLTASAAVGWYDSKTVAAYVRASEDKYGIVVSGVLTPELDETARATLARRKVSGDWRETADGLCLVELLALEAGPRETSEPGFPVATHTVRGRQVALTAALGPQPVERGSARATMEAVRVAMRAERQRERSVSQLSAMLETDRSQQRVALRTALEG